MSFKFFTSVALLICITAPAFAADGVIVTPQRIQAGGVVITEDRIEMPGVSIDAGTRAAPHGIAKPGNDFTNAELKNMDFSGRNLQNAVFVNAILQGVNFENADLRGANFTNADLDGANLNGANLENANLTNATLVGTQMVQVNLKNAILTNVDMSEAVTVKTSAVKPAAEIRDALMRKSGTAPAKIDLTVNFDFNSDVLTAQGRAQVAQILEAVRTLDGASILVQGHTDNVGSDRYNKNLSERRAEAVVHELEIARLTKVDLIAKGYGETEPIATNESDLGRAQNRRVTLVNITKTH